MVRMDSGQARGGEGGGYTFIISAGPEHTIDRRTGSVMCAVRGHCLYVYAYVYVYIYIHKYYCLYYCLKYRYNR
jgi:hypothetical protein